MNVGVLSVGSELVSGDQVDTNAAWLARRITALGGRDVLHVAVDDDHDRIVAALRWLLERVDGVVVGGGLGPTSDDRTRQAVAEAVGCDLERREDLVAAIEQRFRDLDAEMAPANLRQAEVPAGATAFPPAGTAPGFVVVADDVPVWVLPGVPWELRELFDGHVADDLLARTGGVATVTRVVHVTGSGESSIAARLEEVEDDAAAADVEVAYLATDHEVQVKVVARRSSHALAREATEPFVTAVRDRLGAAVAGVDHETGPTAVVRALVRAGRTVAVAESATAGIVTARLAEVPGASAVLRGGVVVYATDTKASLAGVDPELIEAHPPVSREVTAALAEAVRERLGADVGLATTGVAGPDEQDGVAVGTCWWAVADAEGTDVHGRSFPGDRKAVRGRLATAALDLLRRRLADAPPPAERRADGSRVSREDRGVSREARGVPRETGADDGGTS